jgi:hypothetical protein
MSHIRSYWVVVVEPTEPTEAERAFEQWRSDNLLWSAGLGDSDILIDTIRGPGGKILRRYRVRDTRLSDQG